MKLSAEQIEALATELRDYLIDHDLWEDCAIYFNGKAFSCMGRHPVDPQKWSLEEYFDPADYTEFASPILTVFCESPLCDLMNHWVNDFKPVNQLEQDLTRMLSKYGVHYELGEHWNMGLYEDQ